MDYYDYQQTGANLSAPKHNKQNQPPMPGRDELLARNSFPSVNTNRHLTRLLEKQR